VRGTLQTSDEEAIFIYQQLKHSPAIQFKCKEEEEEEGWEGTTFSSWLRLYVACPRGQQHLSL